jgi:hypothetical protein
VLGDMKVSRGPVNLVFGWAGFPDYSPYEDTRLIRSIHITHSFAGEGE